MINKVITYLFDDYHKKQNAHAFKNLLYIFILLKCFFWILNFTILFGEEPVSLAVHAPLAFYKKFAFFLYYSTSTTPSIICLITLVIASGFSLLSRYSYFILDVIIYIIVININAKLYTSLTAGDPLLSNLCFLSIFLRKNFTIQKTFWGDLSVLLHNVSFIALISQICIVYFYSALAKWVDADWLNGEAVNLVNMTHHYSPALLIDHASFLYPVSFVLTYVVLLYQTLFPVLIWFKKIKKPFLFMGIIMHLYIAFMMGLFFFGLIMAITYVLFFDYNHESKKN